MSERVPDFVARTSLRAPKERLLAHWARVAEQVFAHVGFEYPNEACGLMVRIGRRVVYRACRNVAPLQAAKDSFQIHPEDWAAIEDQGTVLAVVHSHPDDDAQPSAHDLGACHASGLPWFIVAWPGATWRLLWPEPLPLVGRQFAHGVVDCYSLVRDYYAQQLGISLPDFPRHDGWWEERDGQPAADLYRQGFGAAGFVDLGAGEPPRLHDVLLMRVAARVENHAAVYVGVDVGMPGTPPRLLHHLYGRLSGHDVWGGDWARRTSAVLRHKLLLEA